MSATLGPVDNVVLVTVDSLRADAVPPHASEIQTPTFEQLASEGTVFEHAYAHGNWTPMSFPSILASRPVFADSGKIGVRGVRTLAETLRDAGVSTAGFNAANGFLTGHWNYDDGFDEFEAFIDAEADHKYNEFIAAHPTLAAWGQLAGSPFRKLRAKLSRSGNEQPFTDTSRLLDVERRATSFIDRIEDEEPFFLWLHYMDAHTPYVPAPRYLRESEESSIRLHRMLAAHIRAGLGWQVDEDTLADLRTLYQGAVRQVDDSLSRVLGALQDAGHANETAVIVTGDHGEEFMEHGHLAHYPKLYDELIHVPLLVSIPDSEGGHVTEHVGLEDIPPTISTLLGVEPDPSWSGTNLLPVIEGAKSPSDDPIVSVTVRGEDVTKQPIPRQLEDGDLLISARTREWTYIENTETGETEFYHRISDPTEQHDLSDEEDGVDEPVYERLRETVRAHSERITVTDHEVEQEPVDEHVEKRLDALGYR